MEGASISVILDTSVKIRDDLRTTLPKYHTRAMRWEFVSAFAILREVYRRLTGDASSPPNNKGRPEKYEAFLQACKRLIETKIQTAADERSHDTLSTDEEGTDSISHFATAVSVRIFTDKFALHYQTASQLLRFSGCGFSPYERTI